MRCVILFHACRDSRCLFLWVSGQETLSQQYLRGKWQIHVATEPPNIQPETGCACVRLTQTTMKRTTKQIGRQRRNTVYNLSNISDRCDTQESDMTDVTQGML